MSDFGRITAKRSDKPPLSAVDRKVSDGRRFDKFFEEPKHYRILAKPNGDTDDTINLMQQIVAENYKQCDKIANYLCVKTFGKIDPRKTAENVWNFVVKYIKYNIEDGEQLRTPNQTWWDGQVMHRKHPENKEYSVDCDCMSIFCACIFKCLGIPFTFRTTGYGIAGALGNYQHVYTIVHTSKGDIICDPVYTAFNAEKDYNLKKDYKMALGGIDIYVLGSLPDDSGTNEYSYNPADGTIGALGKSNSKKAARKAKKQEKKKAKAEKKIAKAEKKQEKKLAKAEKKAEKRTAKAEKKAARLTAKAERKEAKGKTKKADKLKSKAQAKVENAQIKNESKVEKIQKRTTNKIHRAEEQRDKKVARLEVQKLRAEGASKEQIQAAKDNKKAVKKRIKAQKKADGRGLFRQIGNGAKKGTMAPVRGAFLGLLKLNFRGLATRLANTPQAYTKFLEKWKKIFGGNEAKLKMAMNIGKGKKAMFGRKKMAEYTAVNGYINLGDPTGASETAAAVGTWIAVASAALTALVGVLKLCGVNVPDGVDEALQAGEDVSNLLEENMQMNIDPSDMEGDDSATQPSAADRARDISNRVQNATNTARNFVDLFSNKGNNNELTNTATDMSDTTTTPTDSNADAEEKSFFEEHKAPILIGGGLLLTGIMLFVFRDKLFGSGQTNGLATLELPPLS